MSTTMVDTSVRINETIPGWMSRLELEWLGRQARKASRIAEIGSWRGRSTWTLCANCPGTVTAIDTWKGTWSQLDPHDGVHKDALTQNIYAQFLENLKYYQNLDTLKLDSVAAAHNYVDGWFDIVFIDGDHCAPAFKRDLAAWWPKTSWLLCGHDRDFGGVQQGLHNSGLRVHPGPVSLWFIEKTNGLGG